MKPDNLISVVLPVYNGGKYIREAVLSIQNQSYEDWEIILLDDGSTDNTVELVNRIKDKRIKIFKDSHKGIASQLNKGVSLASGKYIARMDSDDISLPERFLSQITHLKQNPDTALVGTNYFYIDESGSILEKKRMPENPDEIEYMMPSLNSVCHGSIMTYKNILQEYKYDEKKLFTEDHDLFLRLLGARMKMYNIQEYYFNYRIWKGNYNEQKREILKTSYYNEGLNYLINMYSDPINSFDYHLRRGILEYYRGSISKSRKLLIEAFRINTSKWRNIIRYLPLTMLGDPVVKMLRNSNVLPVISRGINRFTGADFNYINKY